MRAIIVATLIAFGVHAEEPKADQMTDKEFDELLNKMVAKLSDRLLGDTDLDATTLGKPGAGALATHAALPVARPFMQGGRALPSAALPPKAEELAQRREILGGLALMPLLAMTGPALADVDASNPWVAALLENTKKNKAANDKSRFDVSNFRSRRWSIELFKDPELANAKEWVPGNPKPWSKEVFEKQARDKAIADKAMR